VVADEVSQKPQNVGYDANAGEYVDLVKAGILDPTKVVKTALSNAASIAGLMLTTEALVTNFDAKDENKRAVVGSIRSPLSTRLTMQAGHFAMGKWPRYAAGTFGIADTDAADDRSLVFILCVEVRDEGFGREHQSGDAGRVRKARSLLPLSGRECRPLPGRHTRRRLHRSRRSAASG